MKRIVYALGSAKPRFPPPSVSGGGETGDSSTPIGATVPDIPRPPSSLRISCNALVTIPPDPPRWTSEWPPAPAADARAESWLAGQVPHRRRSRLGSGPHRAFRTPPRAPVALARAIDPRHR